MAKRRRGQAPAEAGQAQKLEVPLFNDLAESKLNQISDKVHEKTGRNPKKTYQALRKGLSRLNRPREILEVLEDAVDDFSDPGHLNEYVDSLNHLLPR
ncbi:MAG: hypothetical protein GF334_08940, partial [Candidatus Altiarchaeales archaeon]|nr:hypothetical protein [Candidatus Altiarchaeales archaeon]